MVRKASKRFMCLTVALLAVVFITGCASFRGKEIPNISLEGSTDAPKMSAIDYSVTWQINGKDSGVAVKHLDELVEKVFNESGIFGSYKAGSGYEEIHFDITMNNHGKFSATASIITGLTLFIIPSYATDKYTLTVELYDKGQLFKTYQYNDYMKTWLGWVFLPMMPGHMPGKTAEKVNENMLRAFIADLKRDRPFPLASK